MLFSLGCVLGGLSDLHRADRRAARARARCEIDALAAGVELVNPSGIDWAYWDRRWAEMGIGVRESTIRREILPLLLGRPPEIREPLPLPELSELPELPTEPPPTAAEIRAARAALEERFSVSEEEAPSPPEPAPEYPTVDPTDPDMALLLAARDRARARAVNG